MTDPQKKPKILFVAMQASPHASRWINMIADQGWDLHLFPVNSMPMHGGLRNITVHQPLMPVSWRSPFRFIRHHIGALLGKSGNARQASSAREKGIFPVPMLRPFLRLAGIFKVSLGVSGAQAPILYGPRMLALLIDRLKPDLIHSMEFQHCSYNVMMARQIVGKKRFPKWLATNWGSDIYLYRHDAAHNKQIRQLLSEIDYYSCECRRDIEIAREMGMTAEALPVRPNSGGFDLQDIGRLRSSTPPSERRLIAVKGYEHFAGRALIALDAIAATAEILKDYRIVVYSATPNIHARVQELRNVHGLNIEIMPHASHEEMLRLFAAARCYLGVSTSDGISTSMLEALAMGAFPIQTNTACCDEWIEDGVSGFSIPPDEIGVISNRIRQAVLDDALVDRAAVLNWELVERRLNTEVLKIGVVNDYKEMLAAEMRRDSSER
ncbi:glycosyltransferase [Bradyrhizobium sp. SYSU BS000235]|uniref:glycosyltransferase n=1 Tax=Bradyrhizobium sp. SYSU BS000235 TaxID=3411332 RepID=UPI003C7329B7